MREMHAGGSVRATARRLGVAEGTIRAIRDRLAATNGPQSRAGTPHTLN